MYKYKVNEETGNEDVTLFSVGRGFAGLTANSCTSIIINNISEDTRFHQENDDPNFGKTTEETKNENPIEEEGNKYAS